MAFKTRSGEVIVSEKSFDASGGEPLPDKTEVLASVGKIYWDEYEGEKSIKIDWDILQPKQYANRKLFQTIKVNHTEDKKADKAVRMLGAIDAMHGGKLDKLDVDDINLITDEQMASALVNKLTVLKVGLWEMPEQGKSGNWIMAVAERNPSGAAVEDVPAKAPAKPAAKATSKAANGKAVKPGASDFVDDDIPF
jgi:hypothetical protein